MDKAAARIKMVDRAVSKGWNGTEAQAHLVELEERHGGYNLVTALVYNGFATERAALKYVGL